VDKVQATVVVGQRREDSGVKYEDAVDPAGFGQRVIKCRVVRDTQIAPEPYERAVKLGHMGAGSLLKSRL